MLYSNERLQAYFSENLDAFDDHFTSYLTKDKLRDIVSRMDAKVSEDLEPLREKYR